MNFYYRLFHYYFLIIPIILVFNISFSNTQSAANAIRSRVPIQGWQAFQWAHVLNPEKETAYTSWNGKAWRRWLFKRDPALKESFKKRLEGKMDDDLPIRYSEVVIIAKPESVIEAFSGNLTKYGRRNQAMVWSGRSFPTFIFQRHGGRVRVYSCGEMFIVARLLNGYPVLLQDFYPIQIRNPLGGGIRYPVSERCRRIPSEAVI